jgi:putative Mn2+ efflux pump MntP
MKKRNKKRILYTFLFSLLTSAILIIHGVFFDMDISQIGRLSIEGFIATFILVFIGLLILERLFTFEEDKEIFKVKRRISKLEKEI